MDWQQSDAKCAGGATKSLDTRLGRWHALTRTRVHRREHTQGWLELRVNCQAQEYQAMSSSCSTSCNIHESQHLIPACPFNGCRYPVVAQQLTSPAILVTASNYLQPSEAPRTHTHTHIYRRTRRQTLCAESHAHTRALCADRCHGYIKAETANFDQLLTVTEWDSGDVEKWRK